MENCSSMNEKIQTNSYNSLPVSLSSNKCEGRSSDCFNLDSHMSDSMKVQRSAVNQNDLPFIVPDKKPYTDYEANNKLKVLNDQIFKETHNGISSSNYILKPLNTDKFEYNTNEKNMEEEKNGFNFKRYFTIFGILALITAAFAYFRR